MHDLGVRPQKFLLYSAPDLCDLVACRKPVEDVHSLVKQFTSPGQELEALESLHLAYDAGYHANNPGTSAAEDLVALGTLGEQTPVARTVAQVVDRQLGLPFHGRSTYQYFLR